MLSRKFERFLLKWILRLPENFLRKISGGTTTKRGRILDAKIQIGLFLARIKPKIETLAPKEARIFFKNSMFLFDLEPDLGVQIENLLIPVEDGNIQARLYRSNSSIETTPAIVYFHGGGFVIGDLETHDPPLRYIAKSSGVTVIAVDYRLGPEHKFPTAVEDAFVAYQWILKNAKTLRILPKKIAVGGDSAGGNLAANVCILSKKKKIRSPFFQLLIYPYLDLFRMSKSRYEFGKGYALTNDLLDFFNAHYLHSPREGKEIAASPILHKKISDFPRTFVQLAGFDPLQDEAIEFIEALKKAKVPVEFQMYETLVHGYFNFAGLIPDAKKALDGAVLLIRKGFGIK
ncbi:alpha/beta hydrolase [Leptospira yasudae]|uniref:Alpha/beta hydrolase n=1 Tax=Leptospira yasudae TaxID=2202201 RepID=A0ABX9M8N2_9LEPT|nr:alpha/beta hydrolase [Leptospira yasudae]RHX82448.1 alpha/beta hydrolase [Leptospira yasudae]